MKLRWYLQRVGRMSAGEIASRFGVAIRHRHWASAWRRPDGLRSVLPGRREAAVALARHPVTMPAVIAAADDLLAGRWPLFHLRPASMGEIPDWFRDPASGITSDAKTYAFDVPYRDEAVVGNAKYAWELSRHQAITMLAAAWWLGGDERYADRVRAQLSDWWAENPFLCGMHWTSGIEIGLRLISWAWIRALLAEWPGVRALFDDNDAFVRQLYHHQLYLRRLHSTGSSANNHLIAELAGMAAACAAFPWFRESEAWGAWARDSLAGQAEAQTHGDGTNREQASGYHGFVFEMLAGTALLARLADQPALDRVEVAMRRMGDALASSLDAAGRPPRFGDEDDGRGVLLDAPETSATATVLDVASALFGAAPWWPHAAPTLLGTVARLVCGAAPPRDVARVDHFPDAGMTLLRTGSGSDEVYVRCDAG
ncbi:MAG: heparinase, partial [Sphingomonas sp.]